MELTLKTFLEMSGEEFNEKVKYTSTWSSTTSSRTYSPTYNCDDKLFIELNDLYPNSGIDRFYKKFCYGSHDNFKDFLEDGSKKEVDKYYVLAYFKVYSLYPQIGIVIGKGITSILSFFFSSTYYWASNSPKIDFKFINKTLKKGDTLEEIMQVPEFAAEAFNRVGSKTEWNNLRITFKKYIPDEKTYKTLTSVAGRDISGFITKSKQLLNSGYYTVETLADYIRQENINTLVSNDIILQQLATYVTNCKSAGIVPDIAPCNLRILSENSWRYKHLNNENIRSEFESTMNELMIKHLVCGDYTFNAPKSLDEVYEYARRLRNSASFVITSSRYPMKQAVLVSNTRTNDPVAVLIFNQSVENVSLLEKYNTTSDENLKAASDVFLNELRKFNELPF